MSDASNLPFSSYLSYSELTTFSKRARARTRFRRRPRVTRSCHTSHSNPRLNVASAEVLNEIRGSELLWSSKCPYCEGRLQKHSFPDTSKFAAAQCKSCNWWILKKYLSAHSTSFGGSGPCGIGPRYRFTSSTVKHRFHEAIVHAFDVSTITGPVWKLRREIHRRKLDLRAISPTQLEIVVGSVLRDYLDCTVRHVGGPGDQGIDLLLVQGKNTHAVQVKRRLTSEKAEGVSVVRNLLGSLVLSNLDRGIVVSTAPRFSKAAELAASCTAFKISLYDHDMLLDLFDLMSPPDPPWLAVRDKSLRRAVLGKDAEDFFS